MENTLSQPYIVLCLCYGGVLCGMAYDVLRLIRRMAKRRWVDALCDGLFVCLSAGLFALCSVAACAGVIRFYTVLSFLLGIFLQQLSLHFVFFTLLERFFPVLSRREKKSRQRDGEF